MTNVIDINDLRSGPYYEPYAGGAGAALSLLYKQVVSQIYINDADYRVYSFWKASIDDNERFIDKIFSVPLDINEWYEQRDICLNPTSYSQFDVGFAAFYMNRCNRSGVLSGAGPIGGYAQKGEWKLDVRFNREELAERVLCLATYSEKINIYNEDAIFFLKKHLPKGVGRKKAFVYLDPPYVDKGKRLYLNSYASGDHRAIASYLHSQNTLRWVLSYDDDPLIRNLYSGLNVFNLPIRYSLQRKMSTKELVVSPEHLVLPALAKVKGLESEIRKSYRG